MNEKDKFIETIEKKCCRDELSFIDEEQYLKDLNDSIDKLSAEYDKPLKKLNRTQFVFPFYDELKEEPKYGRMR